MPKTRTHFICRSCGSVQARWMGKCPDCGAWDALERFVEPKADAGDHRKLAESWVMEAGAESESAGGAAIATSAAQATPLPQIESSEVARMPTGIVEFDRVLGGGLIPGSVVLLGGDPGIGKSTLMLQAAGRMAQRDIRALYVTSEESAFQTRLRAERLFANDGVRIGAESAPHAAIEGIDQLLSLYVLADTNLGRIVEQARKVRPALMVIDSIQMIYKPDVPASPGSVTQLRRTCMDLVYLAKVSGMAIVLVGHITKDGQLAGPKLLEHLVDVVLSFDGDRHHAHRVVRGVKNRFGTTLEVGLFEMTGTGLAEVADVSAMLDPSVRGAPGSVICPAMHGTRCLLVEIQALTANGLLGAAKRKTSGIDPNRLAMLIAVLEKHGGLRLADQDVFVSAVGGLRVVEPAADLAICLAIAGAHLGRSVPAGVAAMGEVGLGGELRHVHQVEQRAREASRLGYRTIIAPARSGPQSVAGVDWQAAATVARALEVLEPRLAKSR